MIGADPSDRRRAPRPGVHWRGHALLFEKRPEPTYDASAGLRLLLIFCLLEGMIGPRLWLFDWLRVPAPPAWLRAPVLLGAALILVRRVAGLRFSQIGFHPWREWNAIERSYFLQILPMATVIFSVLFAGRLKTILAGAHAINESVALLQCPNLEQSIDRTTRRGRVG